MTNLHTAVVLFLSFCCVIESFPKIEDITISKEKQQNKHSCFVKKRDQIKAVVCKHCEVIAAASGYRVTTHHLELLQLHFLHDGRVTDVPIRINCHREEQSSSTKVTQVMSSRKSIAIKLDNKAGIIVVYMDGKSSFSAIQIEPVEDFEINGLHEDTLYQICISVLNKAGESGNYSCVQIKTKDLTNKGSAVANKNGDPCKYAVTSIEADVTAHNLVKVKWKIELQEYCQISNLEVRLFEKHSRKCLVLLVLYKRMKNSKTVETDNCREIKRIRVKSLAYGKVVQFWRYSSVRVKGDIVTFHGKINMNDRDYSLSNLIDTLANTEEVETTCYDDCLNANTTFLYKGIRSVNKHMNKCDKWSESDTYGNKTMYNVEGSRCFRKKGSVSSISNPFGVTPWCPKGKASYAYCNIPYCEDGDYKRSDCIKSVTISSNSTSISGRFTLKSDLRYIILLYGVKSKECIDYILLGISKKNVANNVQFFIGSCEGGKSSKKTNSFTFKKPDQKYRVYIIPIDMKNKDRQAAYYPKGFAEGAKNIPLITVLCVLVAFIAK